jgi:PAS domain S-box-containing protein
VVPDQDISTVQSDWVRVALAHIADAVIVTDTQGRVVFLNPVAQAMTGWTQETAVGKPLPAVFPAVHEQTRQPVEDPVANVLAADLVAGLAKHTVLFARDGTERILDNRAVPIREHAGEIVGVVLVIEDVTEQRRAAQALNASEIRYRRLFETAQDGILILDADARRILDANPFLTDMLGYTHEELLGKELWQIGLFKDIDTSKAAFAELQHKGYIRYEDLPLQTKYGQAIDVEFVSNVYAVDGQRIIQCNIRDVTARKRAEIALREAHAQLGRRVDERTAELAAVNATLKAEIEGHKQAQEARMQLLQQLVSAQERERQRIARELHDQMGQHLAALILGLNALKDAVAEAPAARDRLQQMLQLAGLIGKEIHHLALELRPTALDDLGLHTTLVNYVEEWSERSNVEVDFHSTGLDGQRAPPQIETALYRIVQEGLTNVLKHAQARHVSLILQRSAGQVLAILEDDGQGFDVDGKTNPVGRLGLLGMRERVDLVGGTLTIESTPGKGTTIFVRIPLAGDGKETGDD